jgi:hypothetical protein
VVVIVHGLCRREKVVIIMVGMVLIVRGFIARAFFRWYLLLSLFGYLLCLLLGCGLLKKIQVKLMLKRLIFVHKSFDFVKVLLCFAFRTLKTGFRQKNSL